MFSLFSGKNKCLGVDLGSTGVKIVELQKENNVQVLTNYAYSYDSKSLIQSSNLEMLDSKAKEVLKNIVKSAKFSTMRAVINIPSFWSLISFIDLPEMPRGEIDKAIRFEANKFIPTPLEEVNLGWEIVGNIQEKTIEAGQQARSSQKMQVMVVSVPKNAVEKIASVCQNAGLRVVAMEVENFAISRCLVGNDKGTFMIINIGARVTDFTIISDGVVRVTRSIDTGGAEISRAIASGLGVSYEKAEQLKKTSQINLTLVNDRLSGLIMPILGMIVEEIKKLRDTYHKKSPLKKIEKLILTGGAAKMATLANYLTNQVSIECSIGNSLARIGVEKKYEPIMEKVAPELTTAIGLALREIDKK